MRTRTTRRTFPRLLLAIFIVLGLAFFWRGIAAAQAAGSNCVKRGQALLTLGDQYGERVQSNGTIGQNGVRVELWVNDDTGTWTLLATHPGSGISCIIAAGERWADGTGPLPMGLRV